MSTNNEVAMKPLSESPVRALTVGGDVWWWHSDDIVACGRIDAIEGPLVVAREYGSGVVLRLPIEGCFHSLAALGLNRKTKSETSPPAPPTPPPQPKPGAVGSVVWWIDESGGLAGGVVQAAYDEGRKVVVDCDGDFVHVCPWFATQTEAIKYHVLRTITRVQLLIEQLGEE